MFTGPQIPIVTDGLVIAVDGGTDRSYVSGSTQWKNMANGDSASGGNGSFWNGSPDFIDEYGGIISMNGTSNHTCNFGTSFNLTEATYEVMFRLPNGKPAGFSEFLLGRSSKYIFYTNTNTPATTLYQFGYHTGGALGSHLTGIVNNTWYTNTMGFAADGTWKRWLNGVPKASGTVASFGSWNFNFTAGLEVGGLDAETHIAFARVYDRKLTDAEVLQNFNSQRSRFNL